jgi:hypothetical protein
MKVAWCLYGQPRLYNKGFENISKFINKYNDIEFEFFIHCWWDKSDVGDYYKHSYRNPSSEELLIRSNTDIDIINLYQPKKYLFEKSRFFKTNFINNSLMESYTKDYERLNYNNALSNLYSKYKVNDLLQNYINNNNVKYDLVISTRFDYLNDIIFDIKNVTFDKFYIVNNNESRLVINDSFIITNNNFFNIYSKTFINLNDIINNSEIMPKTLDLIHCFNFVPETILISNLIYNNIDVNTIIEKREDMFNFVK